MAIIISRPTRYGVDATYWKVSATNIDWHNKVADITLSGFIDGSVRNLNPDAVIDKMIFHFRDGYPTAQTQENAYNNIPEGIPRAADFKVRTLPFQFSPDLNPIEQIYNDIKTITEFSTAINS